MINYTGFAGHSFRGYFVLEREILMTFKNWILKHRSEDTPIGDLARDMYDDSSCPCGYGRILRHMESVGACDAAIETLREAWLRYRQRSSD
jgi:uncharacterized protein YozE (UPF0346 family)